MLAVLLRRDNQEELPSSRLSRLTARALFSINRPAARLLLCVAMRRRRQLSHPVIERGLGFVALIWRKEGMNMALTSSAWSYDTSEDHSASVFFISGGYGTIYLKNETEQLRMSIPYKYAALGESNGLDLGFSWADADYLGTGELMTFDYHYFSDLDPS
jgi:hypothetical protein